MVFDFNRYRFYRYIKKKKLKRRGVFPTVIFIDIRRSCGMGVGYVLIRQTIGLTAFCK